MRKQIKLLFLALILFFNFSSLGFCIEPKYSWIIFVSEFNTTTNKRARLYTLKFKEIYKNQDWMEYKMANSGWVCSLRAISQGYNRKEKHDDGTVGIIENLKVSCTRDNGRNIVYSSAECHDSYYGKDTRSVKDYADGTLSFIHINYKGETIYYHFQNFCRPK